MSIGLAGFETGIAMAKQTGLGTTATTGFIVYPAEDASGLTHGQQYIDRNAAYGLRSKPAEFRKRDHTMPGGELPSWAIGFDGTSLGLLNVLRAFFHNYSLTTAGTVTTWAFSAPTVNKAAANYEWWTVAQVSGLAGTRNPWFTDCLFTTMGLNWSTGEAMTLKPGLQALSVSHAGTPSGWGAAPTSWYNIGAAEQAWTLYIGGGTYTLYPSSVSANWSYEAPDIAGAGKSSRARITPGVLAGECSLTIPRNTDLYAAAESAGDAYGTLVLALSPTSGYNATVRQFGKIDRPDLEATPDPDVTHDLTFNVHNVTWTQDSLLGSGAI